MTTSIGLLVLWLFSACTVSEDFGTVEPAAQERPTSSATETAPALLATASPASRGANQIVLAIPQETYPIGEPVPFTITNHLDRDIFYVTGFFRIEGARQIPLRETILEEVVPPLKLAAGETIGGAWDQISLWAPEKEGIERFTGISVERQVPPGQYQLGVSYAFTEDALNQGADIVYSQVFTIE